MCQPTNKYGCLALILMLLQMCISQNIFAACSVFASSGFIIVREADAISNLLRQEETCPKNVFEFRTLLQNKGLTLATTMVANRGFHNTKQGSFSLFEMVSGEYIFNNNSMMIQAGDFFFGHFTKLNSHGYLIADQNPQKDALMIEAFAWDPKQEVFNFYELRGNGKEGQWFYRGNSVDIFADNTLLHRQSDPTHPQFGSRMRCSACHSAGAGVMKELSLPHNDWWDTKRKLDFGGHKPDTALKDILQTLVPAETLANSVVLSLKKLYESKTFYRKPLPLSLQEKLRPLFCPIELNLMSDIYPNSANKSVITIPVEFFIDSRLLSPPAKKGVMVPRTSYELILDAVGSHFPETNLKDADHAWLTPVKAKSDKLAIKNLIRMGIIDQKFMLDVLNVDMTNPVFSSARCDLLRYLPERMTLNWRDILMKNLGQSKDPAAKQLLENMTDPHRTIVYYKQKSIKFLAQCKIKLRDSKHLALMYHLLLQRRAEITLLKFHSTREAKFWNQVSGLFSPPANKPQHQGN